MQDQNEVTVEVITKNAEREDFTEEKYLSIWQKHINRIDEEKGKCWSLSRFVEVRMKSSLSKSQWSQWIKGQVRLNWTMKNELRLLDGVAPLPLEADKAVLTDLSPDAIVVEVRDEDSEDAAHTVIKLFNGGPVNLTVGGGVWVKPLDGDVESNESDVIELTKQEDDKPQRREGMVTTTRATVAQNEARIALGVTWADVYEAGLQALALLRDEVVEEYQEDFDEDFVVDW